MLCSLSCDSALACRGGDDGSLSVDQMTEFINNKQRDPRLNEILYPPLRPAQTNTVMERYQHDQAQLKQGPYPLLTLTIFALKMLVARRLCLQATCTVACAHGSISKYHPNPPTHPQREKTAKINTEGAHICVERCQTEKLAPASNPAPPLT